jgi:hypothetical protein
MRARTRTLSRRHFGSFSLAALSALVAESGLPEERKQGPRPRSLILVWLAGGPSQLETFDPKPKSKNGGPTRAIATSVRGVQIAAGLPLVAEQLQHLALVRSMVGPEGDHSRASMLMKSGRRPEPSLVHPSLGALASHELGGAESAIPSYVSILDRNDGSRGGYLGHGYDPFRVGDPAQPLEDMVSPVDDERLERRLKGLALVEDSLSERLPGVEERTLHRQRTERALACMRADELAAFRIDDEPKALRDAYGHTPFGRGCLAARRLVEVGVLAVEVTLGGWDTHANNFETTSELCATLDPGLATLVRDLRERELWDSTLVICAGEFGRTPRINGADGRDHWPRGFSLVMGGAGVRGGSVIGETSAGEDGEDAPKDPVQVADVFASALVALGLDPTRENQTAGGRPVKLSDGTPLARLLSA